MPFAFITAQSHSDVIYRCPLTRWPSLFVYLDISAAAGTRLRPFEEGPLENEHVNLIIMGRRISSATGNDLEGLFLFFRRLSVALQRFNAIQLLHQSFVESGQPDL